MQYLGTRLFSKLFATMIMWEKQSSYFQLPNWKSKLKFTQYFTQHQGKYEPVIATADDIEVLSLKVIYRLPREAITSYFSMIKERVVLFWHLIEVPAFGNFIVKAQNTAFYNNYFTQGGRLESPGTLLFLLWGASVDYKEKWHKKKIKVLTQVKGNYRDFVIRTRQNSLLTVTGEIYYLQVDDSHDSFIE